MLYSSIDQAISEATANQFITEYRQSVPGGSINASCIVTNGKQSYFVKTNERRFQDMFAAEFEGLVELQQANVIRVPQPVCFGETVNETFIVMEFISMGSAVRDHNHDSAGRLGEQLAELHKCTHSKFGWQRNNTIGSTVQINQYESDWITYYQQHRLAFQLDLAMQNGYSSRLKTLGDKLLVALPLYFTGYSVEPALLHGDLWSGNYAYDEIANPVIFDPAVYYGDRETDIAMTELFGGFPAEFYQSYNDHYPLNEGYKLRKTLYNLYHILNHLNLFGSGYQSQAINMMQQLLADVN